MKTRGGGGRGVIVKIKQVYTTSRMYNPRCGHVEEPDRNKSKVKIERSVMIADEKQKI